MLPLALLVSRDPAVVDLMQRLLQGEEIAMEVSADVAQACNLLGSHKYDAVIVDLDDMLAMEVMLQLRQAPSSRRAMAFALLNGVTSREAALALGANFVLDKPLNRKIAASNIRAARGLIVQERRRYYRHPVDLSAALTLPGGTRYYVRTFNLSQDGIGVELQNTMQPGTRLEITFELPDNKTDIEARGEVAWCRNGSAGIRFQEISATSRNHFRAWMDKNTPTDEAPRAGFVVSGVRVASASR